MLKRLSVVVLASLALGCGPEGPRLRVWTEGSTFDHANATVPFDVRNVGDASAWIPACGDKVSVVVQRWVDNQWAAYSGTVCIAVLPMNPIVLRSGQSTASAFQILDVGRFRFGVSYTAGAGQTAGEQWSYSDAFEVR